jgi:hypothetical protein
VNLANTGVPFVGCAISMLSKAQEHGRDSNKKALIENDFC